MASQGMSWEAPAQQQRYAAVPGFNNGQSGNTTPGFDENHVWVVYTAAASCLLALHRTVWAPRAGQTLGLRFQAGIPLGLNSFDASWALRNGCAVLPRVPVRAQACRLLRGETRLRTQTEGSILVVHTHGVVAGPPVLILRFERVPPTSLLLFLSTHTHTHSLSLLYTPLDHPPLTPPPELGSIPSRGPNYQDPFTDRPSPQPSNNLLPSEQGSMYSQGRPERGGYGQIGAGAAAGGAAGAAGYGAYAAANQNHGFSGDRGEGQTADQLWGMDGGKINEGHTGLRANYGDGYGGTSSGKGYDGAGASGSSKKKWWIGGGILLLLIAIGVGVGVGVSVGKKSSSSSSSADSSSNSTNGTTSSSSDPSDFTKDSRFHNVFYGMAYTPVGGIPPYCGDSDAMLVNITKDIQILSQLTTRLRLYSANCNTTALVMQAIQDTKVNMTIYPAIYVDSNDTAFDVQVAAITDALNTYGADMVEGIAVGNEYILNEAGSVTSGSTYTTALTFLDKKITSFNETLLNMTLSKHIPVGTGDAGSVMSTTLAEDVDYFMANVHPWFGNVTIEDAAGWTWLYFETNDVAPAEASTNKPATSIAETGWPSGHGVKVNTDDDRSTADATVENLQYFLDTYVCAANTNGTAYFYFEPFDEEWKDVEYGGVEGFWGLFDSDRNLKNITIPTCSS
ncbi:uncharacterized protein EHS24_008120 [Apiotrichum porosum]|uniref:glucan endo-1,3-beta-D-glucosidase n=1 Tax=Apiotrichum porosum TaxID=105984 RepID=A0A427XSY5_9TREE|nr:uncharacterized protein EHS24_008120 [Apiotrichum porosum]RSH81923.1 hypothetical protein EHS24_008120 [Apiotrichum porosum]